MLLHIFIRDFDKTPEEKQAALNEADDWYKYDMGTYIVCTEKSIKYWFEKLRKFDSFFICKLDLSVYEGYMQRDFLAFIQKHLKK
jgi:hypothetical protein